MSGASSAATSATLSADALFAAVYDRLKAMAGRRLAARGPDRTLDTTALVHELYLRVNAQGELEFAHPAQFFTYAARAMRHLLSDRARERLSQRAGGGWVQITLTGSDERLAIVSAEQAIALDAALGRLEQADAHRVPRLTLPRRSSKPTWADGTFRAAARYLHTCRHRRHARNLDVAVRSQTAFSAPPASTENEQCRSM